MTNHESGSSSVESSSDDSKKTSKETTTSTKDKKSLRMPLEAPIAEKKGAPKPEALFESLKKPEAVAEDAEDGAETELDQPTPEEAEYVVQEIAKEHLESMADVDAETAEALEPATEFLEKVSEGVDPELAFSEVASELGMTEEEITEALETESLDEELEEEAEPTEADPEHIIDTAEDDEGEVDLTTPIAPVPTTAPAAGGSGSGGSVPPTPPPSGSGATAPVPPTPGPTGGTPGGTTTVAAFNLAPLPTNPNVMPNTANTYYSQRRRVGDILVGGIVGYLIGRRRGRIKTEKRLLPVQRKLEKQVKHLEQNITHKEQQLVAAKARGIERPAAAADRQETPVRAPIERTQPGRKETRLGMEKPARAERLGRMVVTAEAPKTVERVRVERPNSIRQAFRAEEVKMMTRNDLLELSEKIVVEGASLRRIYESRLIGEKQLRHLVGEYLDGKDIRKDLRREMVEREIDFERDPILRDRVRSHLSNSKEGGGLADLLASVGIVEQESDPAMQRRIEKEEQRQAELERARQRQRTVVESALITAVVLLAVAVVVLALRR